MQIYYTDNDPAKCAANLPDALTNKILVEVAQILCTVCHKHGIDAPYKPTHENHPFVKWANKSVHNWNWLWRYARCLNQEWQTAYNKSHGHNSWSVVYFLDPPPELSGKPFSKPPVIMLANTKAWELLLTEEQYQKYLNWKVNNWKREGKNKRLYSWTNRPMPTFIDLS